MIRKLLIFLILVGILISSCNQITESNGDNGNIGEISQIIKNETDNNLGDNLTEFWENEHFSYDISVDEWINGDLPSDEIGKKRIDIILDEYRRSFNTIKIIDNKVNIQHLFDKSNPCTNVNYTVSKIDSKINIVPKKIPNEPKYDPETGEELLMGCIQVIATDFVEINFTLDAGKYTIYFYDYGGGIFSSNITIDKLFSNVEYILPIATNEDARLFAEWWIANRTIIKPECETCRIYSISKLSQWYVPLTCGCELSFNDNGTSIGFGCPQIPEDSYNECTVYNTTCSTNAECESFTKNESNCYAPYCRDDKCIVCCTFSYEQPNPCILKNLE